MPTTKRILGQRADALWARRARAFWQRRQRLAAPGALTGYLLDESPPSLGRQRFEGELAQALKLLAEQPLQRSACLDLGCGTGLWSVAWAREFNSVEAWDYAPAMATAARKNLRAAGIRNARVRCGQITARKGKAAFDLIFVGGVLMYTPESALGPLLKSLARLLKPGGRLLLRESLLRGSTWAREGQPLRPGLLADARQKKGQDYVAIYRSPQALQAALEAAGLRVIQRRPNPHYKLSDLSEAWLRRLDACAFGALSRDPSLAERAARWIYRLRALLLYPEYLVRERLGLAPWRLENQWLLCAPASSTWKAR